MSTPSNDRIVDSSLEECHFATFRKLITSPITPVEFLISTQQLFLRQWRRKLSVVPCHVTFCHVVMYLIKAFCGPVAISARNWPSIDWQTCLVVVYALRTQVVSKQPISEEQCGVLNSLLQSLSVKERESQSETVKSVRK